jgi:outer membrane protein OmpA-like peptidoglycan-associated protein
MKLERLLVVSALAAAALPAVAHADGRPVQTVESKQAVVKVKSFDYGRIYVHTDERTELWRVAQLWRQRPSWTMLTVEGHGFVANDEEASIALGQARADRVRDLLVKYGVDPVFIEAIGHSRATPGRYADVIVETVAKP